jgi:cathepsin L
LFWFSIFNHHFLYQAIHNKNYSCAGEEKMRFKIYLENRHKIAKHNTRFYKKEVTFKMEINKFSDMMLSEFSRIYNGYKKKQISGNSVYFDNISDEAVFFMEPANVKAPDSVDWRTTGAVTPVKNQGQCGSCWAFSATGSLEGQHFRQTGKLVSLSEQNLVDCSRKYGNEGCDGGLMDQAFKYINDNHGIDTEESYPYLAIDAKCHFKQENVGAIDKGFVDIAHYDEDALMKAVATVGPISVAIDASHESFQQYSSGVYFESQCSSEQLDHGVLVGKI